MLKKKKKERKAEVTEVRKALAEMNCLSRVPLHQTLSSRRSGERAEVECDCRPLICLEETGYLFYNQIKIYVRSSNPATEITLQILLHISKIIKSAGFFLFG